MHSDELPTELVFVRGGGTASERFSVEGTAAVANLAAMMRDRILVQPQAIYQPATTYELHFSPPPEEA